MPDAPAAGSGAAPRSDAAVPVARCRCPRCAYALTGLPGAPAEPYGATTGRIRCPECALEIPPGAHCLVGGAAPDVVDPNGGRGVMAIAIGAAVLIGGPWICIMSVVVIREALRSTTLKNGIPMSALQGWMLGALPAAAGIGVAMGGVIRDTVAALAPSGVLIPYASVYSLEVILLLASIVVVAGMFRSTTSLGQGASAHIR